MEKNSAWGTGDKKFLSNRFSQISEQNQNYYRDFLQFLFYEALAQQHGADSWYAQFNCKIPFLNGGLFDAGYEWKTQPLNIPDNLFRNTDTNKAGDSGIGILDVFDRYNFTIKEDEPLEKEVAVDPEMLGKVFENMLDITERKSKGAFYTPREIVHYMCQESLIHYLQDAVPEIEKTDIETFIRQGLAVLENDNRVVNEGKETKDYSFKTPESIRLNAEQLDNKLAQLKICDPAIGSGAFPVGLLHEVVNARLVLQLFTPKKHTAYSLKLHCIQQSIYGVDLDASAVDISRLRLWLSLIVDYDKDDANEIKALPNLDYKIIQGNSLLSIAEKGQVDDIFNPLFVKITELEQKKLAFFAATDKEKKQLDNEIKQLFSEVTHGNQLFDFKIYFSEVWHEKNGFDIVIGNPPYVFARNSLEKGITEQDKKYFYSNFKLAKYQVNLYPLFIEKGHDLLKNTGVLCYITPNNWLTINTNKDLRKFVLECSNVKIVNFYAKVFESAAVDSCIIIFSKSGENKEVDLFEYTDSLTLINSSPADYFLSKKDYVINVEAFKNNQSLGLIDKIETLSIELEKLVDIKAGLQSYEIGKGNPLQTKEMKDNRIYHAKQKLDSDYIKYLDGKDVCRYETHWSGEFLKYGNNLAAPRNDFTLFSTKRILVRQIPSKPPYCINACLTEELALNDRNSMNLVRFKESPEFILAVLNSRLISYWFVHKFGKMQRGVFPQFKVNELARFPIPKIPTDQQQPFIELVDKILIGKKSGANTEPLEREIDQQVYALYGLTNDEINIIEGVK